MDDKLQRMFHPIQANGRTEVSSYTEIAPSKMLRRYVSCYWFSEPEGDNVMSKLQTASSSAVDRVIPDGCSDILFEHDMANNSYHVTYCGLLERPFVVSYDMANNVRRFGIRFFPGGAYEVIKTPLSDLKNQLCELDALIPGRGHTVAEQLFAEESLAGKVRFAEMFLLSLLTWERTATDDTMKNVLHHIFTSRGSAQVQSLAIKESISVRQLNRKCQNWVGVTPKKFSDIIRFQAMIHYIQQSTSIDWPALALNYGFFDQPHMIRDFKKYYGITPVEAAKEFQQAQRHDHFLQYESFRIN
ncbi:helix-turn-helix domain-containing protein [Salipaludibacillus sp. LMS25]|uniref:AraC family transcriptional regulator n=1 Tax=Salipaludibacillus sp. LMS25 TaxID=2924031 RepID=UPI0020D19B3F|nr:helix-turn-helix domain-containing protein [Salipaludibacillus sp. LMS25]UTR13141.1 helix-turn-helix domain-containing protein [Salipaludibacillus sp. LMS25]